MRRYLPFVSLLVLMACQDKVICPAFQSTYILDDSTRYAYYSYVWQLDETTRQQYLAGLDTTATADSLGVVQPKTDYYAYAGEKVVPWRVRGRTKYGIVKYEPYWLKKYRMRTAPMENVFAPEPLETTFVASDFSTDTLSVDSLSIAEQDSLVQTPVIAQEDTDQEDEVRYLYGFEPSDNFNVEELYYIKHFGDRLIDNRPKPEPVPVDTTAIAIEPDSIETRRERRGLGGLFNRRNQNDSTEQEPAEQVVDPLTEPDDEGQD